MGTILVDGDGDGGDTPPPAPGAGLKVKGSYTDEATERTRLFVGGSSIELLPGSITLTAGDGAVLPLDAKAHRWAAGGGAVLRTADAFVSSNDSASRARVARCERGTQRIIRSRSQICAMIENSRDETHAD